MKKTILSITALFIMAFAFGQQANMVVQKVDNHNLVEGNTYRVYVQLPSTDYSLHAVYGDPISDMKITTSTSFYQSPFVGETSLDANKNVYAFDASAEFDSWVTIGADDATANNLWSVGVDFDEFENGDGLFIGDGAWFLLPTDAKTAPDAKGLVLIGQFTTDGILSGSINIQCWDADGFPWQAKKLEFSSNDAHVFGCMNMTADNYNAEATFDDGSCEGVDESGNNNTVSKSPVKADGNWEIFPNPVREDQFNLQFSDRIDANGEALIVEIYDMAGKLVHSESISASAVIGGNRLIIKKELASGNYNVSVIYDGEKQTQKLLVQK